jgi:hypothetical protein
MLQLMHRLTSLRSSLNLSTLSPLDLVGRYLAWTVRLLSRARVTKSTKQAEKKNFLANILTARLQVWLSEVNMNKILLPEESGAVWCSG